MRTNQDPALLRAFAAELKAQRQHLDISQETLANQAGVNRSFMGKLEVAETSPSLTSLYRLARGLQVAPHALIRAVSRRYLKEKLDLGSADFAAVTEILGDDVSFFAEKASQLHESVADREFYQAYLSMKPGAKRKFRGILALLDEDPQ